MLSLNDFSYDIADFRLIDHINWQIRPGRRVALVGHNGAGKTTLLRLLIGELTPATGNISKPKGYRIGYLPQEEKKAVQGPILDIVLEGHKELIELEHQIHDLQTHLTGEHDPADLEKLGALQERFERLGGYRLETEAKAILSGLGFAPDDIYRPMSDFSGGWRMRVHLARLLLQNPDLLLMDEPTNHLDLESLEWLEKYLRSFDGSLVIVSHDRFFIDRLAQEIAELYRGRLTVYAGNYSFYQEKKAADLELLVKRIEEQKAERERIQKFVDRFRYKASKASQVQSRVKQLEKMEKLEIPPEKKNISFRIEVETASFKEVLNIEDLWFRYEEDWVLKGVNLQLFRGEKIALVGINGAGKTTLTRLINHQLRPQKGNLALGERTKIGYYAQHQIDALNLSRNVLEEVAETAAESHRLALRDTLGIFQFSGDSVSKRIEVLKEKKKARVSLAKILLSPVNFLIMDEPTNHLDIASQEALEQALREYNGTLLLISHDRYFLDRLVSRVFELKDGRLRVFEGNYSEYLNRREGGESTTRRPQVVETSGEDGSEKGGKKSKEQKRQEAEARQAISKQRKELQNKIDKAEREIESMEARKGEIEALLANPETYNDGSRSGELQREYIDLTARLERVMARWEGDQEALEELLSGLPGE